LANDKLNRGLLFKDNVHRSPTPYRCAVYSVIVMATDVKATGGAAAEEGAAVDVTFYVTADA